MKTKFILSLLLLYNVAVGSAQTIESTSYMVQGNTISYQVIYPENYDSNKEYPLLLFLHGAGERGEDNKAQLTHGKSFLIDNFHSSYPAIVIVPQCPSSSYWSSVERATHNDQITFDFNVVEEPTTAMSTLMHLVQHWLNSGYIDRSRVYVGGLSMGGMGTYELVWRMPGVFAAAFPICGGANIDKLLKNNKHTAFWIFHGSDDNIVPAEFSREIFKALKKEGTDVKYTEYPGVNHGSWNNAFKQTGLASWLFQHINKLYLIKTPSDKVCK